MNSSSQRSYGSGTPSHGHSRTPRGFSPARRGFSTPSSHPSPGHPHYPSPPFPNFPPPWGGAIPPLLPPPTNQYFTPPHLPYSPLSRSSASPLSPASTPADYSQQSSSPASFYMSPDIPSPMIPPQKRKRFTPIRGHGRGRQRSFRGGRGRGRERGAVGIDAYYNQFMFEDPWRDLLPEDKETVDKDEGETTTVPSHDTENTSMTVQSQDEGDINSKVPNDSVDATDEPFTDDKGRTLHETSLPSEGGSDATCPDQSDLEGSEKTHTNTMST